ncbi:MAG: S-adenosylmethionine decarboxylase [Patescibacteria group bacterium]
MAQKNEVAHSIALRDCRTIAYLQVGGGWLTRWYTIWLRRVAIDRLIEASGFSCFGSRIHRFSDVATDGYTYVMIIGQSSINIHTYPQIGTVTVWIITCPGEDDDGSATIKLERLLKEHFGAASSEPQSLGEIPLQRV